MNKLLNVSMELSFGGDENVLELKVHPVKAKVFPVVMYGCESWTIKKVECRRIDVFNCGVGEDS